MKQQCQIVWFKKDLRINDHKPLLEASKTNIPTIPIYFFETDYWKHSFASKRHWYFIHDSLMDLKKDIKSIKSELLRLNSDVINFLEIIKNILRWYETVGQTNCFKFCNRSVWIIMRNKVIPT